MARMYNRSFECYLIRSVLGQCGWNLRTIKSLHFPSEVKRRASHEHKITRPSAQDHLGECQHFPGVHGNVPYVVYLGYLINSRLVSDVAIEK